MTPDSWSENLGKKGGGEEDHLCGQTIISYQLVGYPVKGGYRDQGSVALCKLLLGLGPHLVNL